MLTARNAQWYFLLNGILTVKIMITHVTNSLNQREDCIKTETEYAIYGHRVQHYHVIRCT